MQFEIGSGELHARKTDARRDGDGGDFLVVEGVDGRDFEGHVMSGPLSVGSVMKHLDDSDDEN